MSDRNCRSSALSKVDTDRTSVRRTIAAPAGRSPAKLPPSGRRRQPRAIRGGGHFLFGGRPDLRGDFFNRSTSTSAIAQSRPNFSAGRIPAAIIVRTRPVVRFNRRAASTVPMIAIVFGFIGISEFFRSAQILLEKLRRTRHTFSNENFFSRPVGQSRLRAAGISEPFRSLLEHDQLAIARFCARDHLECRPRQPPGTSRSARTVTTEVARNAR